jgi:iron complex outermembrane receptor protein
MITTRRAAKVSAFAFTIICAVAQADPLSRQVDFNIAAQRLAAAIIQFSEQAHVQVISSGIDVTDQTTPGVVGRYAVADALNALLKGTGLRYKAMNENTVSLQAIKQSPGSTQTQPAAQTSLALGQADPMLNQSTVTQGTSAAGLSEIIVTAQKRSERLQDVPVPVTVLDARALVDSNQLRLQDYYTSVPGLDVVPQASGSFQHLAIRGITTGTGTNPTVGVTVDDVPYGSSTFLGGGGGTVVPDIDPSDLARVEVLRGPQGTLYGASSMGGLLKFVTVDPSTDSLSGHVQADTSSVYNGAEPGYGFRGSVNVPVTDTLALRASGFTRRDPGYIDNPVLHINGINEDHVSGGRLSALWRPSDIVSLKLSALYQDTRGDGFADVDVPTAGVPQTFVLGDLQQNYLRGTGIYDRKVQAYSATLTAKVGGIDLASVSGYNVSTYSDSYDLTYLLGPLTQFGTGPGSGFNGFGVAGTPAPENNSTRKFTQEFRASASIGTQFDWLVGAFYTYEKSHYQQNLLAENPDTGALVGDSIDTSFSPTYAEYALFADLTYHITDRFDVQIGGRESHIRQTYEETDIGPLVPAFDGAASPFFRPEVQTSANPFTYLLTPRFKIAPDLMLYARLASGYRAGGTNYSAGPGTPLQYSPDKTRDYEVGVKGNFFDRTLSIDASVYYIDWKNIQLNLINPSTGTGYEANGSAAKSQGVELSVESRPLTGLTIAGWVAWDDAQLTQPFPAASTAAGGAYGVPGDRLPYSSRFSGNASIEDDFPLASRLTGFAGGSLSYVGDREGEFTASAQRQDLPAYAKLDLRTGIKYDSWTTDLFLNNVTDKRGVLSGGLGSFPPFGFVYIQPRTVGLSVAKSF